MALKDLFNNFFVIEEEEEVADRQQPTKNTAQAEPEPQTQATTTAQQTQSTNNNNYYNERQRAIKTVPKRQTQSNRLQTSSNERKYQMANHTNNDPSRNVVNMNAGNLHESSKMCLLSHVSSQIRKILRMS